MSKPRILIVEDETRYQYIIRANLVARGFEVLTAETGQGAIDSVAALQPDLVVLDLRLPDIDGFSVCEEIRAFSRVPIIMLTALANHTDRVRGLDCGADDYVPKPFNIEELVARMRAVLRRAALGRREHENAAGQIQVGKVRIATDERCAYVDSRQIKLSPTEYRVLCTLARHAGQVLVYDYLLDEVWGSGYAGSERLVHQVVSRLRQKIEPDPKQPLYIHTEYGAGYVMQYTGPQ
jgi:two-component system KDP operon response regulator KdpE